jgi:hypothetical protein
MSHYVMCGKITHHRDTEDTEEAQRKLFNSLCLLRALCVSVVNAFNYYPANSSMKFTFNSRLRAAALLLLVAPLPAQTQTAPMPPVATEDIFVVDVRLARGKLEFGQPANITNRAGYDNQPSFLPDGQSLLYTSQRENDQTDIYRYDFKTKQSTRLTSTDEGEYSPTVMPGGKFFSVIRVERDKTQRLWKFPLAGCEPSLLLSNMIVF